MPKLQVPKKNKPAGAKVKPSGPKPRCSNRHSQKLKQPAETTLENHSAPRAAVPALARLRAGVNRRLRKKISELEIAQLESRHQASFPLLNPNPVLEVDYSGKLLFCNQAALDLCNTAKVDPNVFIPPDFGSMALAAKTGQAQAWRSEVLVGSNFFLVSLHLAPQFKTIRIYALDITETRRAQTALKNSEERFQSVLENSLDLIYCVNLQTGRYEYLSPSCESIIGCPAEEFMDMSSAAVLSRHVHPDDFAALQAKMAAAQKIGQGQLEYRWLTKNGDYRWLATHITFIKDQTGRPLYRNGVVRDVTANKQTEARLRQATDYLESLFNYANAPIICWDTDFNITRFNCAFELLTGYTVEEVLGKNLSLLFPADHQAESLAKIQRTLCGEHWESVEIPILRKDGNVRLALWNSANVYSQDRKTLLATIAQGQDITERKKKELELSKLNRILKAQHNSGLAMLRAKDESDYLEEVCKIIVEDCGHSMVWVGYAEDDAAKTVRPVAYAGFEAGYLETLNLTWADTERGQGPTGKAIRNRQISACCNMLTDPDFSPWRQEAIKRGYASSLALPLLDDGNAFGAITIYAKEPDPFTEAEMALLSELAGDLAYGVSALRLRNLNTRAEQILRLHNERLLLLSEAADHLSQAKNPTEMVRELFQKVCRHLDAQVYFNFMVSETGESLTLDSCAGIAPEAAQALEHLDFGVAVCGTVAALRKAIHAPDIQHSDDDKVQLVKGFGVRAYLCNPLMAGGRLLGTLSFGSKVKDAFDEGEQEFISTICHYVSMAKERLRLEAELRRQNTQLVEADQRKDDFLAMLAHELRNPLSPIVTSLELIRRQPAAQTPDMQKWAETIQRQVSHLTHIVNDLLDTSRFSRGLVTLKKTRIDLAEVIQQAIDTQQAQIAAKHQTLVVTPCSEPFFLLGDPVRLVQILSNLLENAVKYTPAGGSIWLGARRHGAQVITEIKDTGKGISAEDLPHIFDLFYRADRSLHWSTGGLGLGLTLAKHLAELHAGSLKASSQGLDQGSTFSLLLPLAPEANGFKADQNKAFSENSGPAGALKVLIVEDNQDAAESLGEIIAAWGHCTQLAATGASSYEQAGLFHPDVILLDIGLPDMDGYVVAKKFRTEILPSAKLIALTGYNPDPERFTQAGFDHYFTKPIKLENLEQLLGSIASEKFAKPSKAG